VTRAASPVSTSVTCFEDRASGGRGDTAGLAKPRRLLSYASAPVWLSGSWTGLADRCPTHENQDGASENTVGLRPLRATPELTRHTAWRSSFVRLSVKSGPFVRSGLYWPATADEPESPFGPLVAQAVQEGYRGDIEAGRQMPYQGYFFRVLKAQGSNAPGGAKNYIENGRVTGGFALVAWPAIFGASGIMTFQVNRDGVVFQKDLGTGTAAAAAAITRFDPDLTWARADVTSD
jgi:Protein of unknown function (DUF2950)